MSNIRKIKDVFCQLKQKKILSSTSTKPNPGINYKPKKDLQTEKNTRLKQKKIDDQGDKE